MVNVELLRKTMDHIRENSHLWNQRNWYNANPCGTTMCFAGHAAVLAGFPQPPHDNGKAWIHNGKHVCTYAKEVLGISHLQANRLFQGRNDLQDLENLVEHIIAYPDWCSCCCY